MRMVGVEPQDDKEVIMSDKDNVIQGKAAYEDFHKDVPFWMAIADGILRFHEDGYIDDEGRIYNPMGIFLRCES